MAQRQDNGGDGLTFGLRMLLARRKLGITLGEVEVKTGIPVSTLSRYEHGHTDPPTDRIVLIARALLVTPNDLLGYVGDSRALLSGNLLVA